MWTTDISGSAGYNNGSVEEGDLNGDYYKWFGCTSAATAEVAGLAALVLSVNPYLTSDEVQVIIECTADDVDGSGGWDPNYGSGRVNVDKALSEASSYPAGQFLVRNDLGQNIVWFDNLGNVFLKGILEEYSSHVSTANDEFRVQNSSSADVAIIDASNGNMYITGLLYEQQGTLQNPASDDFIIKDSNGNIVAYVNSSGDLYLKAKLYQSQ